MRKGKCEQSEEEHEDLSEGAHVDDGEDDVGLVDKWRVFVDGVVWLESQQRATGCDSNEGVAMDGRRLVA